MTGTGFLNELDHVAHVLFVTAIVLILAAMLTSSLLILRIMQLELRRLRSQRVTHSVTVKGWPLGDPAVSTPQETELVECDHCDGRGEVRTSRRDPASGRFVVDACPRCLGTGIRQEYRPCG